MLKNHEIEQFNSQGYCVSHGLLTESEVDHILKELDAISAGATLANHDPQRLEMEPKQPPTGTKVRRIYEPGTHYKACRDFSEGPKLVKCLTQLLGPDVLYFSSKINVKPPEIGSVVEWHQDMAYGPVTNRSMLAVLVYLDDADASNGCLQVIPGKFGMLNHSQNGYFQGKVTEPLDTSKAVMIESKRGAAIFFSALAPHASRVNTSPRPRRTLIMGYRAADAYPVYLGDRTSQGERFMRVVAGQQSATARFDLDSVYIPRYPKEAKSLYEIQEYSRQAHEATGSAASAPSWPS